MLKSKLCKQKKTTGGHCFRIFLYCLLLTVCCSLLSSCGYRSPYLIDNPAGDRVTIHIPMWKNRTNRAGLEFTFLEAMHDWFRKNSHIQTVPTQKGADYTLTGAILAINLPGLSYGEHEKVIESEARLTVSFSLMYGDHIYRKENELVLEEAFVTGSDVGKTRSNLNHVLANMADDLAESIYFSMLLNNDDR